MDKYNGGGLWIDTLIFNIIKDTLPRPKKVLEMCAGPAYMGKKVYDNNFCDELHVSDVNEDSLPNDTYIKKYISDGFTDVPVNDFDLIICNPPWWEHAPYLYDVLAPADKLKCVDPQWKLHRHLYSEAKNYLTKGGHLFMIECALSISINTFSADGLELIDHFILSQKNTYEKELSPLEVQSSPYSIFNMAYGAIYRNSNG